MNLLVTGAWGAAKENIKKIEQLGHKVQFMQWETDALPCSYEWVEGVVCNGLFLSHAIDKFVNLRYIQLTSAGLDRVPMDYVQEHGIIINNAKDVYSIPMAEFAVAGVLQLYKKLEIFSQQKMQHIWEKQRNILELFGKKICIIGCGSVGNACAKLFKAFGCEVIGATRHPKQVVDYDKQYGIDSLNMILPNADIVILCLPLSKETHYLIDWQKIMLMKQGSLLVNISRGAVLNTQDLVKALSERLGGAVLDVFEEEPLDSNSELWDMENVVLTPHNSFVGEGNLERLSKVIIDNLEGL